MSSPLPVLPAGQNPLTLDPRTYRRGLSCVHCGLCLPACPTYTQTGNEADSPRGRIQLMLGLSDGTIEPTPRVRSHLDSCLDCRGCETACPSGVVYHELIEETRHRLRQRDRASGEARPSVDGLLRWLFAHVFTHPWRLKLAVAPARALQKLGIYRRLRASGVFEQLPPSLRKMEQMLPSDGALWPASLPRVIEPSRPRPDGRMPTVGFVPGCVGSVMFADVNRKAVDLLSACGARVVVPPAVQCCGAIHHHGGDFDGAAARARRNIDALLPRGDAGVDLIATTIAGCGAMLREYDHLLRDDALYAPRGAAFAARVRDITEVLEELGLPEMPHEVDLRATYHDACHLAHAQRVADPPRRLLARLRGLRLAPLPENDLCCGAAGTYNLTQPAMAGDLAERKLANIARTGADLCVTGNVGCAMHIQSQAESRGQRLRVVHPVELLHRGLFGR